jgi:chemotaxis regulatin CheY-phosphate phosphatase CheZ
MSVQTPERSNSVVEFAPKKGNQDGAMMADDAGHRIMALVQEAADTAKQGCERAMDLARKLSSQLQAAEERARELEAEVNHFRDRAERAEDWLANIHSHVQKTFFRAPGEKNEPYQGRGRSIQR